VILLVDFKDRGVRATRPCYDLCLV